MKDGFDDLVVLLVFLLLYQLHEHIVSTPFGAETLR